MVELPRAEDAEELAMDRRMIRFSLDLSQEDYRRLVGEQHRQRCLGVRISLRDIVLDALRRSLPEPR